MEVSIDKLHLVAEDLDITVTQAYILYMLLEGTTSKVIKELEHRIYKEEDLIALRFKGYINIEDLKEREIIANRSKLRNYFRKYARVTAINAAIRDDSTVSNWIDEYLELFYEVNPLRLGTCAESVLLMEHFLKEYPEYTKEAILEATKFYLQNTFNSEYVLKSHNFILKEVDLVTNTPLYKSELLHYLELIKRLKEENRWLTETQ